MGSYSCGRESQASRWCLSGKVHVCIMSVSKYLPSLWQMHFLVQTVFVSEGPCTLHHILTLLLSHSCHSPDTLKLVVAALVAACVLTRNNAISRIELVPGTEHFKVRGWGQGRRDEEIASELGCGTSSSICSLHSAGVLQVEPQHHRTFASKVCGRFPYDNFASRMHNSPHNRLLWDGQR